MTNTTPTPGNVPGLLVKNTMLDAYAYATETEGLAKAVELMLDYDVFQTPEGARALRIVSGIVAKRCMEMTLTLDGGITQ